MSITNTILSTPPPTRPGKLAEADKQRPVLLARPAGANGMNWIAIAYVTLGLLAFPLCVTGITAFAGGMLAARPISGGEEQRTDRAAGIEGAVRHWPRERDEADPQGRRPS